jgi:eukaryotic-like serine/threonine-protein kinase
MRNHNKMTPERWHRIRELFESALERAPDERTAFLDQACAGDEEVRKEVESLIASHEKTGSFIDAPAFEAAGQLLAEDQSDLAVGQRIGHYKILSLLGAGGMGEVYLAQDTRLGRKLALKMLPASLTADQGLVRRFEQEAHAASALNHPSPLEARPQLICTRLHILSMLLTSFGSGYICSTRSILA